MTNTEAITWLSELSDGIEWEVDMHYAAAIDMAIEALKAQDVTDTNVGDMISRQRVLEHLPSAQIKRKSGEWIEKEDEWGWTYCKCSKCEQTFYMVDWLPNGNYNYCPNCGADMRATERSGEEDGDTSD